MNKLIPSVALGLLACQLSANDNLPMWSDVTIDDVPAIELATQLSEDSLLGSIQSSSANYSAPKRTRMLTGFEVEQHRYKKYPRQTLVSLIYADGKTKITDTFAVRYLFKEIQAYAGLHDDKVGPQKMHFEIAPRYEKWISPNFNYAIEFAYENISGGADDSEKTYWLKTDAAFSCGNHFLFVDLETRYLEREKAWGVESEPLYIYSITDRLKVGGKVLYVDERTDFHWQEWAIKPLVQYRFDNDLYLELRYEKGATEIHDGSGYQYDNYALYTEIPMTEHFSFLIDAAYRTGNESNGNQYTWGDRNGLFAKVGVISSF